MRYGKIVASFVTLASALSLQVGGAHATCAANAGKDDRRAMRYTTQPQLIVSDFTKADELTQFVRSFVRTDAAGLDVVSGSVKYGSAVQKKAIGVGLGLALRDCEILDSNVANNIRRAADRISDREVRIGYMATTLDDGPQPGISSSVGGNRRFGSEAELPLSGSLEKSGVRAMPPSPFDPLQ